MTKPISAKVKAGGLAAAVATIIVYGASLGGIDVPVGVEGALATVAGALLGYLVPERKVGRHRATKADQA